MAKKTAKPKSAEPPLELEFLIACDSVARDPNSGKPTLYGVFEKLIVDEFPATTKPFAVFGRLRGAGQASLEIFLEDPSGDTHRLGQFTREFGDAQIAFIEIALHLTFKKAGNVKIWLKSGRKNIGSPCVFEVVKKSSK